MKEKFNLNQKQLLKLIEFKRQFEFIIPKNWQNQLAEITILINKSINFNDRSYLPIIARKLCHAAAKCDLSSDLFQFLKQKKDELAATIHFKNNYNYNWI